MDKITKIKDFLRKYNIRYLEEHESKRCGVNIPLVIPSLRIAILQGESLYKSVSWNYGVIVLRDEESWAFTLEKLQNKLVKEMRRKQEYLNGRRYKKRIKNRKKRKKINA